MQRPVVSIPYFKWDPECVCVSAVVGWNEKSCKHTSGCVVWAKNTGQLKFEETQWERLKYLQSDHTGTIARTLECVFFFFLTYFLQEFALDSQLPGGHLLRLLTLGFAGSVRVGNVDPELALLLCNFRGTSRCIRNSGNNWASQAHLPNSLSNKDKRFISGY